LEAPLIVAANRDEWLTRKAQAAQVLVPHGPRVLGGRDEVAGGTWLAVNEHGLVAGLTNMPSPQGRNPAKRSRGALPLLLAAHTNAADAVESLGRTHRSFEFNPCWLLVADRKSLFYVDLTTADRPEATELGAGIFVLENRPLTPTSPKARAVGDALAAMPSSNSAALVPALEEILQSHVIPPAAATSRAREPTRPLATEAVCVHAGPYGTRSASIVVVAANGLPRFLFADGPPCVTPFVDVTELWRDHPPR